MNTNDVMQKLLQEIRDTQPRRIARRLTGSVDETGNLLIQCYYQTSSLKTRVLIRKYMEHAGFVWVKKLITRDKQAVNTFERLSTLADYTALAAANDPRCQWFRSA